MRKYTGTLVRIVITIVGLWLAALQIDFGETIDVLRNTRWWWVFGGFMLVNLSMVVRAYRWQLLLSGAGAKSLNFGRLVELYFVGNFFNAFLPSGFGGDVVRAIEVARDIPVDVASGTVFLDRLSGIMILFIMGILALPFRPEGFPPTITLGILFGSIGGLIASFILLDGRLVRWIGNTPLMRWLPKAISPVGDGPIAKFLLAVSSCGWRAIAQSIGVSAIFSLILVGWWTMAGYALGSPVGYGYNLIVVPIFAVVLLVPTIGGIGIREMIAPVLYLGAGVDGNTAVSITIIVTIMLRGSGLLGGPIYLWTTWRAQRQAAEA